ncbi:hypothetical protein C8Q80DRAFT_1135394 [Daedaleopsis nitida]|nr:hypothetical protein C8Q80DRAFT_1135394 [Daedaleopsis nitida]
MRSHLRGLLSELDTRINIAAPVNRLPPDVLFSIFRLFVDEIEAQMKKQVLPMEPTTRVNTDSLIRLTHVCRYWRSVALNAPTLWTCCDNRKITKLFTFFERSRNCLVSLHFGVVRVRSSGSPEEYRTNWRAIHERVGNLLVLLESSRLRRLRRLDLKLTLDCKYQTVPFSDLCVPNLECFTISTDEELYDLPHRQTLWVPILAGHTNLLKALAIWSVRNWLPSNIFPNLTHLTLSFRDVCATPRDLAIILGRTPRLEYLFVDLLIHRSQPSLLPVSDHPITLDRMRSLVFSSCAYTLVMPVMKSLVLPGHCLVRLDEMHICVETDGHADPLPPLPVIQHVRHMDIISDKYALLLATDDSSCGCGFFFQTFYETYTPDADGWNPWLLNLPTMIPLANITSLRLNIHPAHTFWPALLCHLSGIVELSAVIGAWQPIHPNPYPMRVFCDLLSQDSPVLCPNIRTLRVQALYVQAAAAATRFYQSLASMLAARACTGHQISHLEVQLALTLGRDFAGADKPSYGPPESYAVLKEHVDSVRLVPAGPPLCEFTVREVWADSDGMERYWRLNPNAALGARVLPEL